MNTTLRFELIKSFWEWFSAINRQFAADVENVNMQRELETQLQKINSNITWEVGPKGNAKWYLAISPNLNKDVYEITQAIVSHAPNLPLWVFSPARQPKSWNKTFEFESEAGCHIQLDASNWGYVLLRYPDGTYEIVLRGNNLETLSDNDRWLAAAVVLEAILGEEILMERIDHFELVDSLEPSLIKNEKPIVKLKKAICGGDLLPKI